MKIKLMLLGLVIIGVLGAIFLVRNKAILPHAITSKQKPNVILISFDGLQAKHLKSYGYALNSTPNLDAFLKESTVFTNTVSPASWTVPAHMSIFTSMFPSEHKVVNKFSDYDMVNKKGVIANLQQLAPNAMTLAEILKANGYATGGFTGDAGVGPQFGFGKGFDTYFETETFGGLSGSAPKALEWLVENKTKPFFLFLHGYDVHGQHSLEGGSKGIYTDKNYKGQYTGSAIEQGKLREEGLANGAINLSPEDVAFWRAIYDEKINRADVEFKNFLDQVKTMGALENTIVIVMSDHGTEFFEHKRFDHGFTLYGEVIDTLFAIRQPYQTEGQKVDQLVSTLDLVPTVLAMLEIQNPVKNQMRGFDITGAFSGKNVAHNVFSETDYRLYTFKRSYQTVDGWKLILTLEDGKKELYDLNTDPTEQANLIIKNPQKGYELEQVLRQHINDVSGQRNVTQLGCSPVYGDQCK